MRKRMEAVFLLLILTGCTRYEPVTPETESAAVSQESGEVQEPIQLPQLEELPQERVKVKGIYVSAYVAGSQDRMDQIIQQIDLTELNSVVIDVKDDNGRITWAMDSPVVHETGAARPLIGDLPGLMARLEEHEIYPIARITAFRDPYLADVRPEWFLRRADGSVYRDSQGMAWLDPYSREAWDYLVEIGKKAGEAGFREIQFDYVRFPVDKTMSQVVFDPAKTQGRTKTQVISEFIAYAGSQLSQEGLWVSADVFGTIIKSQEDALAVGQDYKAMAEQLDFICPMIYPSHYSKGSFGIDNPDTQPYETIFQALTGSVQVLGTAENQQEQAVVRPWLQDFTASYLDTYIEYGDQEIRDQIQAVYDAGYEEWLLWDAGVSYHYGGLDPQETGMGTPGQAQE